MGTTFFPAPSKDIRKTQPKRCFPQRPARQPHSKETLRSDGCDRARLKSLAQGRPGQHSHGELRQESLSSRRTHLRGATGPSFNNNDNDNNKKHFKNTKIQNTVKSATTKPSIQEPRDDKHGLEHEGRRSRSLELPPSCRVSGHI